MSDTQAETQTKSGLILKAAREEMSLSLEQVAHKLHLRPAVVRAMEEQNYDEFSSDVFLKGYYRTYCRLVNLHEKRMMDLLDQQLLSRKKIVDQKELLVVKHKQAIKRKKLFITSAVFLACVILIGLTYKLSSKGFTKSVSPTEISQNTKLGIVSAQSNSDIEHTELNNVSSNDSKTEYNEALKPEEPEVVEKTTVIIDGSLTVEQDTALKSDLLTKNSDSLKSVEVAPVTIQENIEIQPEVKLQEPILLSSLKAVFSGDCWFKLTDSNGKTMIADLKRTDEEINFKGSAPFQIVIGDASKVSLFFEDKLVNLRPYTSNNGRAALSLKPTISKLEG